MRISLEGQGDPIPEIALAAPGEAPDSFSQSFILPNGVDFVKAPYVDLGYTNYEVWCVGAAGGRGGDAVITAGVIKWVVELTTETYPGDMWADVISYYNWVNGPSYVYTGTAPPGTPEPPVGVISWTVIGGGFISYSLTPEGLAWLQNPTQAAQIINWLEPIVQPGGPYIGGGGGGGGLRVVRGLLADLAASVPVAVGVEGAPGAPGQAIQAAAADVSPVYTANPRMSLARWEFLNRFPDGHPLLDGPTEGSPGGASSFGTVCKASGGKGGKPATQWAGAVRQLYATGGEGGIGGTDVPGGGAAGASTSTSPGENGSWNGSTGSGGGGGRGGRTAPLITATEGGLGSMNFGDISVYGPGGRRGAYLAAVKDYADVTAQPGGQVPGGDGGFVQGVYVGAPTIVPTAIIPANANPGSGGGAKANKLLKYGSRAQGFSPNGVVFIRLYKLV